MRDLENVIEWHLSTFKISTKQVTQTENKFNSSWKTAESSNDLIFKKNVDSIEKKEFSPAIRFWESELIKRETYKRLWCPHPKGLLWYEKQHHLLWRIIICCLYDIWFNPSKYIYIYIYINMYTSIWV